MSNLTISKQEFYRMLESMFCPKLPYRSLKKNYPLSETINPELCTRCGGVCCKRCGCHFSPDDFEEISFDCLKRELKKGYISIDYVDGEVIYESYGVYILRVRNKDSPIVDVNIHKRSPCCLLTKSGCKLDYNHRPAGGRLLIPSTFLNEDENEVLSCHSKYEIKDCCYEWRPHQKVLHQLVDYFKSKDFPCVL